MAMRGSKKKFRLDFVPQRYKRHIQRVLEKPNLLLVVKMGQFVHVGSLVRITKDRFEIDCGNGRERFPWDCDSVLIRSRPYRWLLGEVDRMLSNEKARFLWLE